MLRTFRTSTLARNSRSTPKCSRLFTSKPRRDNELVERGSFFPSDRFDRFDPFRWGWNFPPSNVFNPLWDDNDMVPTLEGGKLWSPRVDVYETKDALVIDAELPGMNKADVKMKVKDGFLELTGERKIEKREENQDKNWKRVERSYGSFMRRIKLPRGTDVKQINASFDKGILKVTIPHPTLEEASSHEVEIHEVPQQPAQKSS